METPVSPSQKNYSNTNLHSLTEQKKALDRRRDSLWSKMENYGFGGDGKPNLVPGNNMIGLNQEFQNIKKEIAGLEERIEQIRNPPTSQVSKIVLVQGRKLQIQQKPKTSDGGCCLIL